ncbi:MarR family transcriptional regulator [Mangrovactinospora gilvigrisea]|uniref:MarR family transcriptional regulator n=1 Tax=Mangrovactinospora gilvigrisea TaxID=1428644 RepID=A0A1J7BQP6_9ACTN|nr:MarR family transcriptional regulator [Mangrovactinospora gilvigrisea]
MFRTAAALRRLQRRRLRGSVPGPPLRGAQLELLHVVEEHPGIGVATAARALRLAPNSVSTLIRQLADLGMLAREPDPDDGRAVRLRLTEAAERRLAAWRAARSRLAAEAMGRLAPADRTALAAALPALRALLSAVEEGPDIAVVPTDDAS